MKNIIKTIAITITFFTVGTTVGYAYSKLGKEQSTSKNTNQYYATKTRLNNTNTDAIETRTNEIKTLKGIEYTDSLQPFSSDIVIYNSHSDELYPSGLCVADVASKINDILVSDGLNSKFIKNVDIDYTNAYKKTRDIITSKVKNYNNTVLLDIHRDTSGDVQRDTKTILFVLAQSNPHYDANKKFADQLKQEIQKFSDVKVNCFMYKSGVKYFNQDLSNKSLLIEVGNNKSSDEDVKECINALTTAIKNVKIGMANQE